MKTNITKDIECKIFEYFYLKNQYRCGLEVTTLKNKISNGDRYHYFFNGRVDFMGVKGEKYKEFVCVEIKISLSDFKSKNGHNFVGNKNYYAVPIELFEKLKRMFPVI